jgi:hypothetical protein
MSSARPTRRTALVLFAMATLVSASGSQCHRRNPAAYTTYGPRVLTATPTGAEIIQVVNANSAKIRSLFTTDATLTVPGAPSLRANLAVERDKKLRLRAETALTGSELDLGSNDELFWFWIRRNPPPTIYFCRHAQFATSAAKQMLPIDPAWLLDALGLVSFDPNLQHSPPERAANGRWQIRTLVPGPTGTMSKLTVIDDARGWVLEQHLYDERGTLVASALTNRQWLDPASGAVVPQEIEVIWPATQFRLKFDVAKWTVNSMPADPTQLFTMPTAPGWSVVDLGNPGALTTPPVGQSVPFGSPGIGTTSPAPASGGAPSASPPLGAASGPSASPMGPMFAPSGGTTVAQPWTPGAPAAPRY